ncbi:ribose 5-phosphate isomerase [Acidothermus cellulolyticus 11B]|uniref:Ribose-5-phosphate isomerase B n=1 Tax=Acidothermus cellulolyticus (strain ATCC 43068 / DSM 8971 / 11B) TaxID=351607 RepID=A0LVB0_ACIC1|nr:ribose-5-phosphate isomerase [Acidothermus cellulolyticus]ABK53370.1 ribose 5-phosphate isomerase [Acidothermus cellulolyticus 11B]
MRVYVASDHAGFELKTRLIEWLAEQGYEPVDCGPVVFQPDDDYPPYVIDAARRTAADRDSFGVVIGGSGNGEQIAANKVRGIRAALIWNDETAALARAHNDANVASIGARQHTIRDAIRLVDIFLRTPFSGEPRHARRIGMISEFEATGTPPEVPTVDWR